MLKFSRIFVILMLVVLAQSAQHATHSAFAQDKIIAVVNNDAITQKDLNDFVNFMRIQLSQQFTGSELDKKIDSMKNGLLDRLIEDRLILQEAKKEGIRIDENRIKSRIDEIKNRYRSNADFVLDLGKQGLTEADLYNKIKEQMLMYTIVEAKVKSRVIVNPSEVTEFYQDNPGEFKSTEQRQLEVINVKDQDLAQVVFKQLKSTQDMAQACQKYGLLVDNITVGANGQLREDIEGIVFKMQPDELSEPVKIEDNYYIFKLIKIISPQQESLSSVQDRIYSFLSEKKMQEKMVSWLDELKKKSYIKIF